MNINPTRKRLALLGCLLLAMTAGASAQQDETAVPLVRVPWGKMTWKMTIISSAESAQASAESLANITASIKTAKDGEVSKVTIAKKNGPSRQIWRLANYTLYWVQARSRVYVIQDNRESPPYLYASCGFYGIEHVDPADEQKATNSEHGKSRYFRGTLPDANASGAESDHPTQYEAWFDTRTGLPKAYREGGTTFIYQFETTPEDVQLPAEYQAALEKYWPDVMKKVSTKTAIDSH